MNLNNISLPYPVLGISDDIMPLLPDDSLIVDISDSKRTYIITIDLKFDNKDIANLIDLGSAEYSCEYECSKTMMRCCVKSDKPHFIIEIPKNQVNGRINFSSYVSVKETILNYSNSGFNEDYGVASFNMEQGDILVAFPEFYYDADIKYDKLQAAGSFMQIRESNLHEEVFFDISGDKIEILLPSVLYKLYCEPQVKGSAEIIHSSLVLNALTYALLNIENVHHENTWVKTIYYRLNNEAGFSTDELKDPAMIPCLAQRLLKDPYNRLFNNIMSQLNSLSEE